MEHSTAEAPPPSSSSDAGPTLSPAAQVRLASVSVRTTVDANAAQLRTASSPPSSGIADDGATAGRAHLLDAVARLRGDVSRLSIPFAVQGAAEARAEREAILEALDGYVLPRLRGMEAPLLVVIGGSTGSGKSTLTNSLIGASASPAGVLRPTTRSPVLVHHPTDARAFLSRRILPGLVRTTASGVESLEPDGTRPTSGASIRLVPHEAVVPGLAILDSPDLDSLVESNRMLARQLFGVADLWLFVTTGTDYADVTPWEMLAEAMDRRMSVAVVLDRMRTSETTEVRRHFATMLRDRGLGSAPVITVPETTLVDGLLPPSVVGPLRGWLIQQATDPRAKHGHVHRAVTGMIDHVLRKVPTLTEALVGQEQADRRLRGDLDAVFSLARDSLLSRCVGGAALSEPVQIAWRRIAESPELAPGMNRLRRAMAGGQRAAAVRNEVAAEALVAAVCGLVRTEIESALARVTERWREDPATDELGDHPELSGCSDAFLTRTADVLRSWQAEVYEEMRPRNAGARATSGSDPHVLGVCTLAVGADIMWIGPLARAMVDAEGQVGDLSLRVHAAREDLRRRLAELVGVEHQRIVELLDDTGIGSDRGRQLRAAVNAVREAVATLPSDAL